MKQMTGARKDAPLAPLAIPIPEGETLDALIAFLDALLEASRERRSNGDTD